MSWDAGGCLGAAATCRDYKALTAPRYGSAVWLPRNKAQCSKHCAQGCQSAAAPVPLADAAALDCTAGAARSAAPLLHRFVRRSSLRRFIAASMLSPHESSTSATACAACGLKRQVSTIAPNRQHQPSDIARCICWHRSCAAAKSCTLVCTAAVIQHKQRAATLQRLCRQVKLHIPGMSSNAAPCGTTFSSMSGKSP